LTQGGSCLSEGAVDAVLAQVAPPPLTLALVTSPTFGAFVDVVKGVVYAVCAPGGAPACGNFKDPVQIPVEFKGPY
jgi:hypothetical protein